MMIIKVFKTFECKDLLENSILYLKTDICHSSDGFQKFPDFAYKTYNLDPRHSYTYKLLTKKGIYPYDYFDKKKNMMNYNYLKKKNSLIY